MQILLRKGFIVVRNARLLLALGLALVLGTAVASNATAVTFTLSAPVALDGSPAHLGVLGSIDPVYDLSGTFNTDPAGLPSFAGVDVMVFDVTLSGGSSDVDFIEIATGAVPGIFNITHAGVFTTGAGDAPDAFALDGLNFEGDFDYTTDHLTAGETTVRLFTVYTSGSLNSGDTSTIRISSGTNFMVQGTIVPVPEPGTLALAALGLAGLAFAARRRAR